MTDEIETNEAEAPRRGRPPKAAVPDGFKACRVLKRGDGQVSKGYTEVGDDGITREQYYAKGDELHLPAAIADALEDRGFVET